MSKVNSDSFSQIQSGKVLTAENLTQDREILKEAVNDNQLQLYRVFFGEDTKKVFTTKAQLDLFPSPVENDYAFVLTDEEESSKTTMYKYVTGVWVLQATSVSLKTIIENIDTLDELLGIEGANFIKSAISTSYAATSLITSGDQIVIEKEAGGLKRISFGDFSAASAENFVGIFATASGLSCPDAGDLLCVYPNGIADPDIRFGWAATVTNTNSKWKWIVNANEWQDTGEAPSVASGVGYTPTLDPSTNETNVQDAMVEHGTKIEDSRDRVTVVENKTQNFNESGNVALDLPIETGKDISSVDLSAGTSATYTKIIQALIAEWGRNNDQDDLVQTNIDDIVNRLVKDFSALLNKSNPSNSDLLVLWDGAANKNISFEELTNAIETQIQFYVGFYASMTALRTAHPTAIAGNYATIGGEEDTQAIWDVEGNDWVETASKLYFTKTAGNALEVRVGNNEGAITAINVTLGNKENTVNKLNTKVGNEGSTQYFLTIAGVEEYVEPIRIRSIEDNEHVQFIQLVSTTKFQANLNDSEWREGRIIHARIDSITVQAGTVEVSIDGGSTFKNLAAFNISTETFVDFDLSINNVFGRYIKIVYYAAIDKAIIYDTNENLARIVGAGWSLDTTLMGEKLRNDTQDTRLSLLEGGSLSGKAFIVASVAIDSTVITAVGLTKLVFNSVDIDKVINSNDTNVIDTDVNGDIVVKENAEPGYRFTGNFTAEETGNADLEIVFYLFDKNGTISVGNELDSISIYVDNGNDPSDRSKSVVLSNEQIANLASGGFPATFAVYYQVLAGDANILKATFTAESMFTGSGVATSDNVALLVPATESRSGALVLQSEHNEESVNDRKNLLEAQKVIVSNDQGSGQFMANKPEIVLDTNKVVRVVFTGSTSDLTDIVELSLDNGSNYYDVEYRETTVDLTVKNALTHVMELYFTGTKFIATFVDSPIENQDLPYAGAFIEFEEPKNGIPAVIVEETTEKVKAVEGMTLDWLVPNPNFRDGIDGYTFSNGTLTVVDGIGIHTGDGSGSFGRVLNEIESKPPIGTKIFTKIKFRVTNADADTIRVFLRDGTSGFAYTTVPLTVALPNQNQWYEVYDFITTTQDFVNNLFIITDHVYPDVATENGKVLEIEYAIAVLVPDGITTEDEMNNLLDGLIRDKGIHSAGEAIELDQLLDNRNEFGNWTTKEFTVDKETEQDGISYQKYSGDATSNYGQITGGINRVSGNKYTYITHIIKNTLDGTFFFWNAVGTSLGIGFAASQEGIIINSSEFVGSDTLYWEGIQSTTTKGELIKRTVILEGDQTALLNTMSDEEILEMIKYQEFGTFDVQDIRWKTVGKNKWKPLKTLVDRETLPYVQPAPNIDVSEVNVDGVIFDGDGKIIFPVATTRLNFTITNLKPNSTYTISWEMTSFTGTFYRILGLTYISYSAERYTSEVQTDELGNVKWEETGDTRFAFYTTPDLLSEVEVFNIQLELGTVATEYEVYKEEYAKLDAGKYGLQGIGGVYDTLDTQKFGVDESVLKAHTSWGTLSELTNTIIFRGISVNTTLGGYNPSTTSTVANCSLQIGSEIYHASTSGGQPTEDYISVVMYQDEIRIRANKTTIGGNTSADLEAYLQANDVKFIYELETSLPREEKYNNEVIKTGLLLVGPGGTAEVFGNGVLPNQFKATSAVNTKSQTGLNTGAIIETNRQLKEVDDKVEAIKVKTDNIIVSEEVNLNQVAEWKLIYDGSLTVPNTTGGAANVTLDESMDNFDFIAIEHQFNTANAPKVEMIKVQSSFKASINFASSGLTWASFLIERLTSTTLVADDAKSNTITVGSPANITEGSPTNIVLYKIYGIKL